MFSAYSQAVLRLCLPFPGGAALLLLMALPVVSQAQASPPALSSTPDTPQLAQRFALEPILSEVGESRTRQWLASLRSQCGASKAKNLEVLCSALPALVTSPNWGALKQSLDQILTLKCGAKGFMTAYYEPVLQGTLVKQSDQQIALYALPEAAARALQEKQVWFSRAEIENLTGGASSGLISKIAPDLTPIAWIDDPVEAFFLHIQGSGRVQLRDQAGSPTLRVGFAGHNGHSYLAIGSSLVSLGEMLRAEVSANSIKAWLKQRLSGSIAISVMHSNPRYVFFKRMPDDGTSLGPLGALGLPLTEMASVAADPAHHPLGSSMLVFTQRLGAQLVQVQDVGGGIKGAGRLDLFTGTGDAAGQLASDFKEPLWSLEIAGNDPKEDRQPRLQLDIPSALANCSGGM
jgi:membrane-bound lytic murein transglycosylase A